MEKGGEDLIKWRTSFILALVGFLCHLIMSICYMMVYMVYIYYSEYVPLLIHSILLVGFYTFFIAAIGLQIASLALMMKNSLPKGLIRTVMTFICAGLIVEIVVLIIITIYPFFS